MKTSGQAAADVMAEWHKRTGLDLEGIVQQHIKGRDAEHATERERLEARIQALRDGLERIRRATWSDAAPETARFALATDDEARKGM
jgi:hypothetical protein